MNKKPPIDYATIPEAIAKGLELYVKHGYKQGDFLHAVLCNDLATAVGHADPDSWVALPSIVSFVYFEIPGTCWGSKETVDAWIKKHEAARRLREQRAGPG